MNISQLMNPNYWKTNRSEFQRLYDYDLHFNASFRGTNKLSKDILNFYEMKCLKLYRKAQVSKDTIWYHFHFARLKKFGLRTGINLWQNMNIGKGLIIGHSGTIILNGEATFGENIFMTHGVTIGRDVRGHRKGAPTIGSNVCIRANSTVVGKITIGDDVLIAPNTFVNFDVPSHSIVVGSPGVIHHRDWATEGHLGLIKD